MKFTSIHYSEITDAEISEIPGRGDLRIVLTSRCNLRCAHCHNEGNLPPWLASKNEIKLPQIEELISVAAGHGARSVKFTGGDPTVHKQFMDLLRRVKEWRLRFPSIKKWGISTNGLVFLKPNYFDALLNSDLDNICVGIDSIDSGELSKPSSKIGVAGACLFSDFVQPLAAGWPIDRSIKVNVVFDGNVERVTRVVSACVAAGVNVGIIELNGVMGTVYETREAFKKLYVKLREDHSATETYHADLNEFTLIPARREKRISFYQDHCADLDCGHCRNIHTRISPAGGQINAIPCFLQDQNEGYRLTDDDKVSPSRFRTALNLNGRGPNWKGHADRYETDDAQQP